MFRLIRNIFGYKAMDKRSYLCLVEKLSKVGVIFKPLEAILAKAHLKYASHVERMPSSKFQKIALHAEIEGGVRG